MLIDGATKLCCMSIEVLHNSMLYVD